MPKYIDADILKCVVLACDSGREAAFSNDVRTYTVDEILQMINAVKPANVKPIKRGHWIEKHRHRGGYREVTGKKTMSYETHTITVDERYEIDDLYCSECGKLNESVFTNFCPNCGADMRENIESLQDTAADAEQFADQPVLMSVT